MSKDLGKKIKILAIIIGAVAALACLVMAFLNINQKDFTALFVWIFLAIIFVLLIWPLYAVGTMIIDLAEQREKTQNLTDRLNKVSRTVSNDSPADRFSPSGRIKIQKLPQTQARTVTRNTSDTDGQSPRPQTAEPEMTASSRGDIMRSTAPQDQRQPIQRPTAMRMSSPVDDFTRSLVAETINDLEEPENTIPSRPYEGVPTSDTGSVMITGPSPTLKDAFSPTLSGNGAQFNTAGFNTYEINRKIGKITKTIRNVTSTISAGGLHSAFVYSSGRAKAVGYGTYGQCNVESWTNLIAISAGNHHTVGLRSNGTCVATGYNGYGQCDVEKWCNVCQIATGFGHSVALLENGTCVATGDNAYGQCNVFDWTDIVSIVAGYNYTVGLRVDGTIVAVGANTDGQWGAIKWGGISAVAAGGFHTVGLKNDGTCVAVGNNANDQCEVGRWTNVTAVAAGNYHTVCLHADGTCSATGYNGYGQCDVSEWRGIVEIAAGRNHTLGLMANGRVVATGDNTHNQCSTSNIVGVKVPRQI